MLGLGFVVKFRVIRVRVIRVTFKVRVRVTVRG